MRQIQNDPPGFNKGDPKKHGCYETIEKIVSLGKMDDFRKAPKKIYDVENYDFNQLDFPINHMTYISSQYKLVDRLKDNEEYKRLKIRFHVVLEK